MESSIPVNPQAETIGVSVENQTAEKQKPVSSAERIKTLDIIRGVALLGILLMNIPGFGIVFNAFDGIRRGPHNTADFYTDAVVSIFFEGTMRGLFSMLFGVGMVLFTLNKVDQPGGKTVAELYYRRLLWLTLFGLINAYIFLWVGDILFFYGLCGMVLYPFRKAKVKWLFLAAFVCIAAGNIKNQMNFNETREKRKDYLEAVAAQKEGKKLSEEQTAALAEWPRYERRGPDPSFAEQQIREVRSSYGNVFDFYLPFNSGNEAWGTYHWAIWDCTGMMLIGMALFSLGFFSNKLSTSTYSMTLLLGYGIGIPIGYIMYSKGILGSLNFGAYIDSLRAEHGLLYDFKRVFLSLGHASLIMLVFRSKLVPWLMKGLSNVGQMAFTNYLMQSIICTLIFHGYGLGYFNKLAYHQLYYVVGGVWIFQIIFSAIWLRFFSFGPFEWLWRSLTYWKQQPMMKA